MSVTPNWITKDDLLESFGERDLPIDDLGIVSDEKIDSSIEYSTLYVESYLRAVGIALPATASIQLELKECMLNITRYNYSNNEAAMTEEIRKRYEDCLAYLNKILKGSVVLSDTGTSAGWSQMVISRV